jgi:hypothetical protein
MASDRDSIAWPLPVKRTLETRTTIVISRTKPRAMDLDANDEPAGATGKVAEPSRGEPLSTVVRSSAVDPGENQVLGPSPPIADSSHPGGGSGFLEEKRIKTTEKGATMTSSEEGAEGREIEETHPHSDPQSKSETMAEDSGEDFVHGSHYSNAGGGEEEDDNHTYVSLDVGLPRYTGIVFTFDVSRLIQMIRILHLEICHGCK